MISIVLLLLKNPPAVTMWKHETCGLSCIWVPGQWSLISDSRISILWSPEIRTVFLAFPWAISHLARRTVENSYKRKEALWPPGGPQEGMCMAHTASSAHEEESWWPEEDPSFLVYALHPSPTASNWCTTASQQRHWVEEKAGERKRSTQVHWSWKQLPLRPRSVQQFSQEKEQTGISLRSSVLTNTRSS